MRWRPSDRGPGATERAAEGPVRDFLAESEKALGRPLSDEERQRVLENLKVATRDIAARKDTRGERALQRLKEGDPAEAERLFAEELETETKAAAERNVRAAKAARNLAALARPTNVAKAAEYYKRAADLDPTDGQTWLNYASAALAAGRLDESKVALEQAAAKAAALHGDPKPGRRRTRPGQPPKCAPILRNRAGNGRIPDS